MWQASTSMNSNSASSGSNGFEKKPSHSIFNSLPLRTSTTSSWREIYDIGDIKLLPAIAQERDPMQRQIQSLRFWRLGICR